MANYKMASTLLCVLLMGQQALGVLNKSPAQSSGNNDKTDQKDEPVAAEDRIISDVYGAPPQLSNEYGPPHNGGGFNGPAPVYGPPELTGNHGPVQVFPPPPPELPPPPPQSFGLPRKPKPQYGPPKQSFGPPSPGFGPKPGYGPPKPHFGSPSFGFSRPPKPQYGPPLKFSGPPNLQYGPPRFGGSKPGGHGPPIPISLETYGPPNKGPSSPFASAPQQNYGPPSNPPPQHQPQHGPPAGDLYGPPPPPPPGVPAPPTPPDIKYDGWQPIAGLVGAPNQQHGPSDSYGPPDSGNGHFNSHGSSSGSSSGHSSGSHSSSLILDGAKHNVPSDSYGEPIHNQDAHNLQSSVHESTNSHGLPPPPLPQTEPLHNNQGPAQSISGHQEQHQHHDHQSHQNHQNLQNHQFGSSGLLDTQYGLPNGGDLKAPAFEFLPEAGALTGELHGLSLSEGGASSFATSNSASNSFHADLGSSISLPALTLDNFGAPLSPEGHHDSHGHQGGDDLTLQQLPITGPSPFSGGSFGGPNNVNSGLSLPPPPPVDSYGAPPASSYSPSGSYPLSQGARGGSSWLSAFNIFGSSGGHKQHSSGHHHHHHHRNHGPPPPFRHGPPPPLTGSLIPPRSRAPIKFREQVPSGLLANINRYLPPVSKPSINYGAPLEQQLPSLNGPLSFQSSSSANSFGNAFTSGGSFGKNHQVSIAAPNVHYGTPLSFNSFNTPAPVLTYGAPNFGPETSFVSTSLGSFAANHNLYNSIASNGVTTTYGTPVLNAAVASIPAGGPLGGHDCGFHKSGSQGFGQFANFAEDAGHPGASGHQSFGNSLQLSGAGHADQSHQQHSHEHHNDHQQHQQQQQNSGLFVNAGSDNSVIGHAQQFTDFPGSSISDLDLESHEQQKGDLKDSYGNPVGGLSFESSDQTPALTTNEIHATVGSSSAGFASQEFSQHSQQQHHQQQNSFVSTTNFLNDGASAEALTAALTAQGYGEGKNFASNELAQDTGNHYSDIHPPNSDEAIALAQTLQADGADGFQIQGSKGTYMLQIQAAGGGLGTENSDGSIRHDQVLSNGLLQDILAAIEQPGAGPVEIQGPPQPQQLQHVYDQQVANGHHQNVNAQDGPSGSHSDIVEQVLAAQSNDGSGSIDIRKSSGTDEHVALFYNNNSNNNDNQNSYDESRKEIRSTSKSEGQASLSNNDNARDSTSNGSSQAEATKKSS